jgi:hypothetical protein
MKRDNFMNLEQAILLALVALLILGPLFWSLEPWPFIGPWQRMAWCKKCHRRVSNHQATFDSLCKCGAGSEEFGFPHVEYKSRFVRRKWFGPRTEEFHPDNDRNPPDA